MAILQGQIALNFVPCCKYKGGLRTLDSSQIKCDLLSENRSQMVPQHVDLVLCVKSCAHRDGMGNNVGDLCTDETCNIASFPSIPMLRITYLSVVTDVVHHQPYELLSR